jgi:hypothetical protein
MSCYAEHNWVFQDERDGYKFWHCAFCTATEWTPVERDDDHDSRVYLDWDDE